MGQAVTLRALITADISDVFLQTDEFAETVTRQIGGLTGNTEDQTGIVFFTDTSVDRGRGKGQLTDATIDMADANEVTINDSYLINCIRYEVMAINPTVHGTKKVDLRRYAGERAEARSTRNLR